MGVMDICAMVECGKKGLWEEENVLDVKWTNRVREAGLRFKHLFDQIHKFQ